MEEIEAIDKEMTVDVLEERVRALLQDSRFDDIVPTYLDLAKAAVVQRVFPFKTNATFDDVPEKYHWKTCEIAVYLINKRGAEGETMHVENGITRMYSSADIPATYFDGIMPFCGVPK